MISKKYPEGFTLMHPKNWNVQIVDETYIWASAQDEKQDSSFVFVYPFFLQNITKSLPWLQQNLAKLTKFFNNIKLERTQQFRKIPDEILAKFRFKRNNISYQGIALCSIYDKSGILYIIGSAEELFEKKRNQLVSILKSFKFLEPEKVEPQKPSAPRLKYTTWKDPLENAFILEVPQGWAIQGGTFRRAAVDLVHVLVTTSEDQKIRIQFNDSNLPVFATPSPVLTMSGFREGTWYSPGYGVQMLVKRYTPGHYFLNEYLQSNYRPKLVNFEIVSQKELPDVVATFNRIYSQFLSYGISFTLHAGEAAFRYDVNTEPFVGYSFALTQVVQSTAMQGGQWSVPLLVIYTSPASEAKTVHQISDHMFRSFRMNPQWVASQQQLTANVSQIVNQTNQEISRIINDSYWTRQRTLDNIHRRFSNYILGMTDVTDPTSGEKWKVEAGHNYYWRKDYTNLIAGTEVYERPDIDFSPLKEF
ncbi:MAG: hypothetical protein ACETWK_09035 [Candidatus Aminicenantaceae bacterium]